MCGNFPGGNFPGGSLMGGRVFLIPYYVDDTKQAKSLIVIVVPQVEQFPKVQKEKDVRCY